jgi:predicted amidohydrolase
MIRVLLAALCCQKGDPAGNLAAHEAVLREAAAAGCDIAVFPEMSLSGSVEPATQAERLLPIDADVVTRMAELTAAHRVAAVFGIAERAIDGVAHITQLYARDGAIVGHYRKRHLGEGEEAFGPGSDPATFRFGEVTFGIGICAESGVDYPWDEPAAAGARLLFFPAAPGLHGRRVTTDDWVRGFDWWESCGLADARRNAARTGTWIGLATQAGTTEDEDFPGIAALIDPTGAVVSRLPDWREGRLIVDIPVP